MIGSSEIPASRPDRPVAPAATGAPPTFCPRCRAAGHEGEELCRDCGDRLVVRGYCSTCEGFWKRPVGDACPKHDVPLEDAPPPPEPLGMPGQQAERWVTVATYGHPNEANPPRIRLEAEGIATFLDGERVAGSTLYQVATGGARLQVPESMASAARVLLAQTWAARIEPPEGDTDPDDDDDPWAGLAPAPGARRRAIMKAAIIIMLFGPGVIALGNVVAHLFGWVR